MTWFVSGNDLTFRTEFNEITSKDEYIGRATKCNSTDPTNISISWTPKKLSPSGQVEITFSYIAPHDMYGGFLNVSVYFHGELEPFVGYSNMFSCDDIKQYFNKCPIKRRIKVGFSYNITNLHFLTSFPGDYDAVVDIRNEKNEEMLCLNFTLNIKEI
ncbi:hypothetical protein BsWGS_15562 [Bradybaena similaris]